MASRAILARLPVGRGRAMQHQPDYSSYHLHELEAALADIDESKNPEEASIIREHIKKGGYTYPVDSVEPKVVGVRFVNASYKWFLVSVLSLFFLGNLIALVIGHIATLVPIALQGSLLFMIYMNHKYTRALIKVWSSLIMISGLSGAISTFFAPDMDWSRLVSGMLIFGGGLMIFVLSNRFVELVQASPDKA